MMSKEKKEAALVIDGNNFAHRAYHTMNMKFGGKNVGIIFGFMNMMGSLYGKYKPKQIIVTWDGGRHPERLKIDPEYKGSRKKKIDFDKDNFEWQLKNVRKLVYYLGIPQIHQAHREADDFIYAKQKTLSKNPNIKVIICSGDKDFRAHVKNNVFIHDDKKGLITPLNFEKLFKIHPHQYVDWLAMLGDDSDNIKGINGIGEKTALKLLEEFDTLEKYATLGTKNKWYDKIQGGIGRPKSLIDLAWFYKRFKMKITPEAYYKGKRKPKQKLEKYHALALKFGLRQHRKEEYTTQFLNLK